MPADNVSDHSKHQDIQGWISDWFRLETELDSAQTELETLQQTSDMDSTELAAATTKVSNLEKSLEESKAALDETQAQFEFISEQKELQALTLGLDWMRAVMVICEWLLAPDCTVMRNRSDCFDISAQHAVQPLV